MNGFVKADIARVNHPSDGAGLVPDVVDADAQLGLQLLRIIGSTKQTNVFLSPYSVATALTMAYAGARGDTAAQLGDALGIRSLSDRVHNGRNVLDQLTSAPRAVERGLSGVPLTLDTANSLWAQAGETFLATFLGVLARDYGAGMHTVDFAGAPEEARVAINRWVADHTHGRIPHLLRPGIVDHLTRLVLVNAITFKASWMRPFDPTATADGTFTRADGSPVTVPMMRWSRELRIRHAYVADWHAVWLRYLGGASMIVLLPDVADATLDPAAWKAINDRHGDALVTLTMPKFAFGAQASLVSTLRTVGLRDLFTSSADLSGMDGKQDLCVKAVEHHAAVTVDEYGTQAAAATGVVAQLVSRPPSVTVTLDRPFTFVIQDDATGEMLFLGRVADPTAN